MSAQSKRDLWKKLNSLALDTQLRTLSELTHTPNRNTLFNASASNIKYDYANQLVTPEILTVLFKLAENCQLHEKIANLMDGAKINTSENRPALHTALRASAEQPIFIDSHNIMHDVINTRAQIQNISEQIRTKQWLGFSGKPITDIVNIGIGGAHLGAYFCITAFTESSSNDLNYHFIADADPKRFHNTVANLNPDTTLFIINSKSFTTPETLYQAKKAVEWIGTHPQANQHFIAITAQKEKALQFGCSNVLSIWDWVGGRYSLCSAVNLITAIAIGFTAFNEILAGAASMDQHFRNSAFTSNLPVILGLLGIWNNNFLNTHHLLMLTYAQQLEHFVPYVQQLDMESNGKSIDNQGRDVTYATGPIVWGGLGNQAQHSYYQLLCQGTHKITADIITIDTNREHLICELSNAKIQVLTNGVTNVANPNDYIPGNTPLNHLCLKDTSAFTIGALIALYEHKIFVQSVIWDINPFDQPGVESAKRHKLKSTLASELV